VLSDIGGTSAGPPQRARSGHGQQPLRAAVAPNQAARP
jgi:hypothetical protein